MAKEIKVVLARADSLEAGDVFESPHLLGGWRTVTSTPVITGDKVTLMADGWMKSTMPALLPVRVQIPA